MLTNIRNQTNVIDYLNNPGSLTSSGGCQGMPRHRPDPERVRLQLPGFFGVAGGGFSRETAGLPTPQVAEARLANKKYFTK